jgi:carboxymethylenebutenolidase
MCHTPDSRPPAPPVVGDIDSTGSFELTAADGNVLAAYEAIGVGAPRARVVILPDVRGLHPYYRALAERFAEAGLHAVAIDYFGRTAGPGMRDDDFDWQPHIAQVTPEHVRADVGAAVAHLFEGSGPIFTVGFCIGGSHSWRLAASDLDLAGVMGFYGRPSLALDVVPDVRVPVLMLVAGADQATPVSESQDFAATLEKAGKDVEIHVYDGAPHSFFDRSFDDHADACADAWRRMLAFVDRHGRSPSPS